MSDLIITPSPYQDSHNQSCDTGIDVHHCSTGKIDSSHLLEKSSSPYPVCHRHVNQNAPEYCKHQETSKLDTLGKSSKNQGRRNDGKHTLEKNKHQFRYVTCSQGRCSNSL